jgi:hypothetical protein
LKQAIKSKEKMTAQIAERLNFEGQQVALLTNPLDLYFELGGHNPGFQSTATALWRGYVGSWEVVNDRLYLIELQGELESGQDAELETVFSGYGERVFAHWYSGVIRLSSRPWLYRGLLKPTQQLPEVVMGCCTNM